MGSVRTGDWRPETLNNDIYKHALRLLARRDYSVLELCEKLQARFGTAPREVIDQLISKKFLDDRRFAENYVRRRKTWGPQRLREELLRRGIGEPIIDKLLDVTDKPSLRDVLKAKMQDWRLRPPLAARDAARLFRHLRSLGHEEEAIREELEKVL